MKRRTAHRMFWLLVAAVVAVVGIYGVHRGIRWRHNVAVEVRLRRLAPLIQKYAQRSAVPPDLVREVIRAESGGDEWAVSDRGAVGLMQVLPATAQDVCRRKRICDGNLFDPEYNLRVGTAYLRILLNEFGGDPYLALAAYNWGPKNVAQARRENPGLSGREIVEKAAPAVTVRYCRGILGGLDRPISGDT